MALHVPASQFALHNTSKKVTASIKTGSTPYGFSKLHTTPTYKTTSDRSLQPIIPSPDNFEGLSDKPGSDKLPSAAQCAVHLEFLCVLHELRERIVESKELDEILNIKANKKVVTRKGKKETLKDNTLPERKQAKWNRYVEFGVVRFLVWWNTIPEICAVTDGEKPSLKEGNMPPLDILMVWHSFLLNPRWFRQSCGDGKKLLYKLDFPWAIIHQSIDPHDWTFSLSSAATKLFQETTSLAPNLLDSMLLWKDYDSSARKRLYASNISSIIPKDVLIPSDTLLLQHEQQLANTSSQSTKDLKAAVTRQLSFVDKMWDRIWIRSPGLSGTLSRALLRYSHFLALFKLYPTTMFVPTLDIDLAWHTHQCSAVNYYKGTQELAGKFVNHDDSIVQDKLDTGMEETKKLYRMRFGREYHICGCWDCEALLEAVEKAGNGKDMDWEAVAERVSGDVLFYRAVEVARRTGKPVPIR